MDSLAEQLFLLLREQMERAIAESDLDKIHKLSEIAEMNGLDLIGGVSFEFDSLDDAREYLEYLLDGDGDEY